MRIFFDTEFIEDGKTIDLISIGMVREDGAVLYMENKECKLWLANDWVKENVIPHLTSENDAWDRVQIATAVKNFVGDRPEFWAYYAAYDWVALCQLYGTMMRLPKGSIYELGLMRPSAMPHARFFTADRPRTPHLAMIASLIRFQSAFRP